MKQRGFEIVDDLPKDADGNAIVPALPIRSTQGAAGYDLCSISEGMIMPGQSVVCRTGVRPYMQSDECLLMYSRSGMGFKHGIVLKNGTGVFDSDFHDEMLVALRNEGNAPYMVHRGDKIAQAVFMHYLTADEGSYTNSGKKRIGGCGSTGK